MIWNGDVECLDWQYHAEGNANIILKSFEHNLALRLRKATIEIGKVQSTNLQKTEKEITFEQEMYYRDALAQLFEKHGLYLDEGKFFYASERFIKHIVNSIEVKRPHHRKHKQVKLQRQAVLIMPFLGSFPCNSKLNQDFVAIELKPKWGFLPVSPLINKSNSFKKNVCRFCLHQNMKLKEGSLLSVSEYCPLDLFGDCKCKIKTAIQSLLKTPQNNISIILNDSVVDTKSEKLSSVYNHETITEIVSEILVSDSMRLSGDLEITHNKQTCQNGKFKEHGDSCVKTGKGGLLNILSRLQRFDNLDIESIGPVYKEVINQSNYEESDFVHFISKLWSKVISSVNQENKIVETLSTEQPLIDVYDLCRFLLSATFKDCSIILTFCEMNNHAAGVQADNVICTMGRYFKYKIKLIDLDPRFVENIPYYYELDQKIVSAWKENHVL